MKAVLYTRVSKDRQRRGKSVQQQEDEARLACAALGWEVVAVFSDNDRSASRYALKERAGYADLLAYLRANNVDALVLWETSRASRELEGWASFLNLCRDRSVQLHVVSHGKTYDPANPRDRKSLQEDGVDAEYESDKTRERILRNVRANAAAGRPHGKLAFGYTRVYDERGAFVEQSEQPEQSALLREMARRVLDGESLYAVANDLNARGLSSPGGKAKGWHPSDVKRLLVNPAYAGKRVLRGIVVGDAVWPAILTEDEQQQLIALLTDPARATVADVTVKHLLSGLITCGECCGTRVNLVKNGGYPTYSCRTKFCIAIRTTRLDRFVTDLIIERLSRPDAAEVFSKPVEAVGETQVAKQELATLQARLESFAVQGARGNITAAMLARVEAELSPLIADAERRVAVRPPTSAALRKLTTPGVNVAAVWEELDILGRREVVHTLMRLHVVRGRRGTRTLDPIRLDGSRWAGDSMTWGERRRLVGS